MIPFNRACFEGNELAYLTDAVVNGHVSGNGPFTKTAENLLEGLHGQGRALLTTSCTHALEISACLLRLEPGDEVIIPSFTFVSTASAFMIHGGTPRFVDVDPVTLNMNLEEVRRAISPKTRAICAVHYAGIGANPDTLRILADEFGLFLIEDNAHGLGGLWNNQPLGTFGQLSTLSFHETKNVTCGEGGAILINDERLVERAEILREKGTDRTRFLRGQVDKYTWVEVGSSWVMSDLLAGVLVGQLERFHEIQKARLRIWNLYHIGLSSWARDYGVKTPMPPSIANHPAHLYHLRFDSLEVRTRFIDYMKSFGIGTVFHYQPLHLSSVGARLGGRRGHCPVTEDAADTLVSLPLHLNLTSSQIDYIVSKICEFRP